jgi:hypothetical protein
MQKKIIIFAIIALLLFIGIRACYLKDYITVLRYPEENSKIFISPDSITIAPHLYVENANTLGAVIDFARLTDSLLLEDLTVTVHSDDNPNQSIALKHISTVVHPVVITTYGHLEQTDFDSFNDLPFHYKTIRNSGLPYNKITFLFKTRQISNTDFYTFKISGKFIYKGTLFHFEKQIKTERKVEYHPYRMMT